MINEDYEPARRDYLREEIEKLRTSLASAQRVIAAGKAWLAAEEGEEPSPWHVAHCRANFRKAIAESEGG